jgi:hypothetical protein
MIGFVKSLSPWILKTAVGTRDGETSRFFDAIRRRPGNQEHPRAYAAHSPMPPSSPGLDIFLSDSLLAFHWWPSYDLKLVCRVDFA